MEINVQNHLIFVTVLAIYTICAKLYINQASSL